MFKSEENSSFLNVNANANMNKIIKRSNPIINDNISETKTKKKSNVNNVGNDDSNVQESNRNFKRHANLKLKVENFSQNDQKHFLSNQRQRVEEMLRDKIFKKTTMLNKQKTPQIKFHSDKEVISSRKFNNQAQNFNMNYNSKLSLPFSTIKNDITHHREIEEELNTNFRKLKTNKLPYNDYMKRSKKKENSKSNKSKNDNSNNINSNYNSNLEDEKDFSVKHPENKNLLGNIHNLKTNKFINKNYTVISDVKQNRNSNNSNYLTNLITDEHNKLKKNQKVKETTLNISNQEINKVYRSKTQNGLSKKIYKRGKINIANSQNTAENKNRVEDKLEFLEDYFVNQKDTVNITQVKPKRSKTAFTSKKKKYQSDENSDADSDEITESLISLNLDKYKLNKLQEEIRSNMLSVNLNNSKTSNKFQNLEDSPNFLNKDEKDEEEDTVEQEQNLKEKKYRYITRKGLVYDSFSDEENDKMEDKTFVIHQDSQILFYFELFIFIAGIYSVIFTPVYLAFFNTHPQNFSDASFIVEIMIDILMIAEVAINFFVSYLDFEEKLILNRKMIITRYIYSWFLIDIISAFPFHTFLFSSRIRSNITSNFFNKTDNVKYLLKSQEYDAKQILIVLRLFKLIKIFKSNRFLTFINQRFFEDLNIKATLERLIEFLLYYIIITHIVSCIFIFLGYLDTPNWIIIANLQESSSMDIYIASIYFNWTTIFTIGYGDIHANSIYERVYSVILLMIGVLVYSYAVSSLANFIQEKSEKEQIYEKNIRCLERISIKYKLQNKLYKKIERSLKFNMTNSKIQETELLNSLPTALKNEMILRIYKPIIKNFIFFKHVSNSSVDFTIKAIMCLKPISAVKDERLVNEGEFIDEIIFVKMGALVLEVGVLVITKQDEHESKSKRKILLKHTKEVKDELNPNTIKKIKMTLTPRSKMAQSVATFNGPEIKNEKQHEYYTKEYLKIIELRRNEHFGDILMFLNKRSPLSVRVKTKTAELFTMKKTDVVSISMSYPNIFEKICKKSIFNHKQLEILIKRTKLLFYQQHKENFKQDNEISLKKKFFFTNPLTDDEMALQDYKLQNLPLNSIPSEENTARVNVTHSNEDKPDEISNETSFSKIKKIENVKNHIHNFKGRYTISEKKSEEEEDEEFKKTMIDEYVKYTMEDFNKNRTISDNINEINLEHRSMYSKSKNSKKMISSASKKNISNLSELSVLTHKKSSKFKPKILLNDTEEGEINLEIDNTDDKIKGINLAEYRGILPQELVLNESIEAKNLINSKFEENLNELKSSHDSKNFNKFSEIKEKLIYQPILYNVNIKNNYNLGSSQEKITSCSMCESKIYPLSTNRIVVLLPIEQTPYNYKENLAWTNVQISQNNSFEIKSIKTYENSCNVLPKIHNKSSFWLPKKEQDLETNYINEEDRNKNASLKPIVFENPLYKRKSSIESFHKQINLLLGFRRNRMSINEKLNLYDEGDEARTLSIPNHQNTDVEENKFYRRNSRHMMTQIYKNIENNSLNLNDPQYFYSELLKSAMSKKNMVEIMKNMNERLDKMQTLILINKWKKDKG